jgi:hypothetical protein
MATDPEDDWQERFEAALKKAGPLIAEKIIKDSQRYGTPLIVIHKTDGTIFLNPYTFERIPREDFEKPIPYPLPTEMPDEV